MPVFVYTARDTTGKEKTGTVDARARSSALSLLKEQGLFVVSIEEKGSSVMDRLSSIKGIPAGEIVAMSRQLSTMISAGLPISKTLEVLIDQTQNQSLKKTLTACLRDVEGGTPLSVAFSKHPKVFSPTYVALVKAGESSGKLDEVMDRIATTLEAERELNSKFKSAMIYPTIVMFAMVGVFVLMMGFVIPKLAEMYESLNAELPFMTQIMIDASNFFVKYWYIFLVVTIGTVVLLKKFLATPTGRDFKSRLMFGLPVFGKINKNKEFAQFTRTLSLLISAAIPIVEALHIVSDVSTNTKIRKTAIEAASSVEKGNALSDYLRQSDIFPPLIAQMASVGEETGQVDELMAQVAQFYDNETEHAVKGLSAALEPIILIVLGAGVGLLIVSIITPIYKITSSI